MSSDLIFEGRKYVSSKRASELCGYSQDYVGQLVRLKKIEARMIGRGWFVAAESILEYKKKSEETIISASRETLRKNAFFRALVSGEPLIGANIGKTEIDPCAVEPKSFLPELRKDRISPPPSRPLRKRQSLYFQELLGKAIAATLSLSLVLGCHFMSDVRNARAWLGASEALGVRISAGIGDTVRQSASAVQVLSGAYLAGLHNSGLYVLVGMEASIGASRDMLALYASAVDGAGSVLAQSVEVGDLGSISMGAVSTAVGPVRRSLENIAMSLYQAINPLLKKTDSFFVGVFNHTESDFPVFVDLPPAPPIVERPFVADVVPARAPIVSDPHVEGVSRGDYHQGIPAGLSVGEIDFRIASVTASLAARIDQVGADAARAAANGRAMADRGSSRSSTVYVSVPSVVDVNSVATTSVSTSTIRSAVSSSATGLTYSSNTGDFSLTSGYVIPLTASTSAWDAKISSQWVPQGSDLSYDGKVAISQTATPYYNLDVNGAVGNSSGSLAISAGKAYETSGSLSLSAFDSGLADFATASVVLDNVMGGRVFMNTDAGSTFSLTKDVYLYANESLSFFSEAATNFTSYLAFNFKDFLGRSLMYVRSDGSIGVGTTTPEAVLSIQGSSTSPTTPLFSISSSTGSSLLSVLANGNVGVGTSTPTAQLHTTGTVRFSNFGAGTVMTDANGNLSVSSDERLKNIEGGFTRGLSDINKISPILYKWNLASGFDALGLYAGFSAQNVELAIPEAVGVSANGYLSLNDRPILAAAINAIKELGLSMTSLDGRLTAVEGRITSIEAIVADLRSATRTPAIVATDSATSTVQIVGAWLASLGVSIENTLARFASVIAEAVTTKKLTVGDALNLAASGITILDRATGAPVCMYVEGGVVKSSAGACAIAVPVPAAPVPTVSQDPVSNNELSVGVDTPGTISGSYVVTGENLFTSESGATAPFTVVLDSAPLANVTIPVTVSNLAEGSPSANVLVFTPDNWNVYQTVTVTGLDDSVIDGNAAYTVILGASQSDDFEWRGIAPKVVHLTNYDNDEVVVAPAEPVVTGDVDLAESVPETNATSSEPVIP